MKAKNGLWASILGKIFFSVLNLHVALAQKSFSSYLSSFFRSAYYFFRKISVTTNVVTLLGVSAPCTPPVSVPDKKFDL